MLTKYQSAKTKQTNTKKEDFALLRIRFNQKNKGKTTYLHTSHAGGCQTVVEDFMNIVDYRSLISKTYDRKTYSLFLELITNTNNIIPEAIGIDEEVNNVDKDSKKISSKNLTDKMSFVMLNSSKDNEKNESNKNSNTKITLNDTVNEQNNHKDNSQFENIFSTFNNASDINNLNEQELKSIIEMKMSRLNKYNSRLENKIAYDLIKKYKLDDKTISSLKKLQGRIRCWVLKRKFFKALRMNQYIEHRKNYLRLKKCMEKFDNRYSSGYFSYYYRSVVDVFNEH